MVMIQQRAMLPNHITILLRIAAAAAATAVLVRIILLFNFHRLHFLCLLMIIAETFYDMLQYLCILTGPPTLVTEISVMNIHHTVHLS